jgi:uncharacterized protein (UPF0218 family)
MTFLKDYLLTESVKTRLKHPLGSLILGSPERTMSLLTEAIRRENPPKVCVVGDFTALKTIEYDIKVDLYVVDNKVMRQPVEAVPPRRLKVFKVRNPPGTITSEAWAVIKRVIEYDFPVLLVVEGEEDLLALPVIKLAPNKTYVVYGQPHAGLVLVRVTEEKKKEIGALLDKMKREDPQSGALLESLK